MKHRQLLPIVTVTVVALATLGQKARKGARINVITAMRRERVLIPNNCKQSVAARKAAKVTKLSLSSKRQLRDRATAQCHVSMVFAGVDRITNVTHGLNQRWITDLSSQPANKHFDELCIVFVRVFPNTFAQLGAREDTARLAH